MKQPPPSNSAVMQFPLKTSIPLHLFSSLKRNPTKMMCKWQKKGEPGRISGNDQSIRKKIRLLPEDVSFRIKSERVLADNSNLSSVMIGYASKGLVKQARVLWDEMINRCSLPGVEVISELIDAYGKIGRFDEVTGILDQISSSDSEFLPEVYSLVVSCFGKWGQLELMESTMKEMVSRGLTIDSSTGDALIKCYGVHGSLTAMEAAYGRLKRSRHSIGKEGIRAVSSVYIKEKKFYRLGEFVGEVGMGRKNIGNLLWNLLLLSYAANFKMKSLQKEFLRMLEAGFHPDLTTFNIRTLAFAKMSLFWDLHVSLEHMRHEKVNPDLVTYGCIVDAYLDRRLGRSMDFALNRMRLNDPPMLSTDPLVFEVLGKGDFHMSSEAFLEFTRCSKWSYRELIAVYLRKHHRSNQIFWNY